MYRTYLITLSDSGYYENAKDLSADEAVKTLYLSKFKIVGKALLPDDKDKIENLLSKICDENIADIIFTMGGTGFSKRDNTPEATRAVIEKETIGLTVLMHMKGINITEKSALSRAISGIRKKTLIINLPGSPKAVRESLENIIEILPHALDILLGTAHDCAGTEKNRKIKK